MLSRFMSMFFLVLSMMIAMVFMMVITDPSDALVSPKGKLAALWGMTKQTTPRRDPIIIKLTDEKKVMVVFPDGRQGDIDNLKEFIERSIKDPDLIPEIKMDIGSSFHEISVYPSARLAPPILWRLRDFIEDVRALDDGVVVKLTQRGIDKGKDWTGAGTLGEWTLAEYELQRGRLIRPDGLYRILWFQTRFEIWYHSLLFSLGLRQFAGHDTNPVNVSFGKLP